MLVVIHLTESHPCPSGGVYHIVTTVYDSFFQLHLHSMMYTCLVEAMPWRVVWRSSTEENGALFVMTIGT